MAWIPFLIPYLLLAAVILVLTRAFVPRRAVVRQEGTRLVIASPLLARVLHDQRLVAWGTMSAFLVILFVASREWLLVAVCLVILLRISWLVYRNVTRGTLVIDPGGDAIQLGRRMVGRVSELVALQVSPAEPATVVLVLRGGPRQDRGVLVRGLDRTDGHTISSAIASYLHVPIMEST